MSATIMIEGIGGGGEAGVMVKGPSIGCRGTTYATDEPGVMTQ